MPEFPDEKSRRRSRWLTFGVPLALLGTVLALVIAYDDPPPDDSDMEPKWAQREENSNPLAQFCVDIVSAAPTYIAPTAAKPDQDPQISTWETTVAEWPSALHLMEKLAASDPATWQWPDAATMHMATSDPHYHEAISGHAFVWEAKAKLLSHQGNTKEAVESCFALLRIGQGMIDAQGNFDHQRLGMSMVTRGLELVEGALISSATPPETLRHCIAQLDRYRGPSSEDLTFSMKLEYQRLKHLIRQKEWLAAMGKPNTEETVYKLLGAFAFKPNRTLGTTLTVNRAIVPQLHKGHLEGHLQSLLEEHQLNESIKKKGIVRTILGANLGGLQSIGHFVSGVRNHLRWAMAHDSELRQARIVLALRLHELEKGTLPAKLEELVPAYLPSVPIDPFSKQSMHWNAATNVVYSVGPDLKDDHGHIKTTGPRLHKDDSMLYWWRDPAKKSKAPAP